MNLSIEANSVDPEQTAPDLGKHLSRREKQTTFVAIGAFSVSTQVLMCCFKTQLRTHE